MCVCVFKQHFLIKAYLIKCYRQPLSIYFCFNPFKFPYSCFDIQLELALKFPVFNWFPSTFMSLSGHHQGGRYILQKYSTVFYLYWCNFFHKEILASLDVENLFTNVSNKETIDIIINNIYNNPSLPSLKINPNIL